MKKITIKLGLHNKYIYMYCTTFAKNHVHVLSRFCTVYIAKCVGPVETISVLHYQATLF